MFGPSWVCTPRWVVGLLLVLVGVLGVSVGSAWGAAPEAPSLTVGEPVFAHEAVFYGVLDPLKSGEPGAFEAGSYEFLYRASKAKECKGGSVTPAGLSFGGAPEALPAEAVSGLASGTEYAVCLQLETAGGTTASPAVTFVTAVPPEAPVTVAKEATATTVKLEGTLNPKVEAETGYHFAYSDTGKCTEGSTSEGVAPAKHKAYAVPAVVATGLEPSRKYEACLVAQNTAGETTPGNEVSFTTLASKPSVDSESVSGTNSTSSTLEAQVNPNNQETSFSFEYASKGATGAGGKLEGTITTLKGENPLPAAYGDQLATVPKLENLTPDADYYYRVDATNATGSETGPVELFTTVPAPTTDPATNIEATTATLNGHFALNETTATRYSFTYSKGPACAGENPVTTSSVEASTGKGTPVAATAAIGELTPDNEYTACLTTSNQFGSETAPPIHFTSLIRESVVEVTDSTAELQAEINPDNAETTYTFEYGPTTSYSHTTPEQTLFGEDADPHTGTAKIQELAPATEYHYRAIATNTTTHTTTTGPDQTFTTQATGGEFRLPDNRAWEMVSPPNKHGAALLPQTQEGGIAQAAANGAAVTYAANAPITAHPEGNVAVQYSQVLSTRNPSGGWTSREVTTPYDEPLTGGPGSGQRAEYLAFSPTLSSAVIERIHTQGSEELPLSPLASESTIYLREALTTPAAGDYVPLVNDDNVAPGTHYGGDSLAIRGVSTNLEHIVFTAGKLTGTGGNGLYEWTAGTLHYVGEGFLGDSNDNDSSENVRGAVSEDGQHVFFDSEQEGGPGHLYARLVSEERTVQLDVVQGGPGSGEPGHLRYQYATPNGMKVYFTDDQRLTPDSTAERAKPELYEYDFAKPSGHELTDLTPNPNGTSTDVQGEAQISEDGEYIYFYASGKLNGAAAGDCSAETPSAVCNLYLARVSAGTVAITLLAELSAVDYPDWGNGSRVSLPNITSGASPDGDYLTFMSSKSLTGYDNRDVVSGTSDEEVFLYDAVANQLTCVSCDPTGARPHGALDTRSTETGLATQGPLVDRAGTWEERWLAGLLPGWTSKSRDVAFYRPRYLTNGGRLFFDSADSLVPQDANASFDVYEFTPEGPDCGPGTVTGSTVFEPARQAGAKSRGVVGGGNVEEAAGCVVLISSGHSDEESAFLDASANGPGGQEAEDVFFLTADRLSPQDVDTAFDVYDAHVCSALAPCSGAALSSPPCSTAESCRTASAAQPSSFGAPASATYSGPGNVTPPAQKTAASKPLTRSQRLAGALKRCRRDRDRHKRGICETQAQRKYAGAKPASRQRRSVNTNRRAGR
jgi:hypothetical protein